MTRLVLLSFDVEEFDIPEEYGRSVPEETQFKVSLAGLESVLQLLEQLEVRATFFVTANFAQHYPDTILRIAKVHEIASHGFYHSAFELEDLEKSKQALESLTNRSVTGFRMPRLKPIDDRAISTAGYTYNSSMNPTYLPGRYNNFFQPRSPYYSGQLLNLPVSVTPLIRFPLFWLSFKNLPLILYQIASQITLSWDGYLNLYFHPWEFAEITGFSLPSYIQKHCGTGMIRRLRRYLIWLKPQAEFITCSEFQTRLDQKLASQKFDR